MTDNGEGLRIDIDVDLGQSEQGLDSLITTLGRLQSALETATSSVQRINSSQFGSEMEKLAGAMKPLAAFEKTASAALEGLAKFTESASNMSVDSSFSEGMVKLVDALKPLGDIAKGDFVSVMNQLKKFPDIAKDLANTNLDEFAAEVKRLAEALKPLAEELGKVAAGFAALPKGITGASEAVSGFSSASKFGRGIKLGALFYTVKRVKNVMADWVETSNDYIENLNLFTVAMREGADEALEYAEKVQSVFAIDPSEWIRFQSVFQNMLTGFGIGSEKASGMSKTLTQLGYDLSTLFNVDYATAMKKLQSGIAGQPRPMREWGFDLSETTLKLTALNFGIKENVETMTQYEKSQLRFMQIMDTAKKQGILGNFAREIHTPANAMRILQQQIVQLKRALGNLLIPILMKVLPYLQAFVIVVTDAIRALGVLVGFELPELDYSGVEYGGIGGIGDDLEDIEDGAGGANSALQKLRNTILGIDELNLMADPTSGGAGGGGGGGAIGGGVGSGLDFDLSDFDYDFLGDTKLKAIELVEAFYDKIRPVVDFIRDNFDWISTIVLSIGAAMLAWKIATGVQAFVNTLAGMTDAGKITLGIALMLGGIALGASGFTEIFSGQGTLGSWLKAGIGAGLGIGGSLITFGTGPLGWTIGIGLVLTMVIMGVTLGYKQGMKNIIEGVMQGNGGVLITELASAFSQKLSEITITLDPLIVGSEKVRGFASEAESYKTEMVNIFTAIQLEVDDSAEAFENLNSAMQDFTTATQNMTDEAYTNVISALSGAIAGAAGDAKVEWEGLLETIYLVKAEGDRERADRMKRLSELQTAWAEGTISQQNFKKATLEIYEEIAAGERAVLDASISFDDLLISMKKIDWQDEADRSKAFEDIGGSVQSAREKVNEALNGLTEDFYVILADVKDPQLRKDMTDAFYLIREEERDQLYRQMGGNLTDLFNAIQIDMVKKVEEIGLAAGEEWENSNAAFKSAISKSEYVYGVIDTFKNDYMNPISEEMNAYIEEFGLEGNTAMLDATDNINSGIFSEEYVTGWFGAYRRVTERFDDLSNLTAAELDILVKELEPYTHKVGDSVVGGVAGSISDDTGEIGKAFDGLLGDVNRKVINFKPPPIRIEFDVRNPQMPKVIAGGRTISLFADGGFPETGQMFIAREAGPELVGTIGGKSAVANDRQIEAGIARGVADAQTEQNALLREQNALLRQLASKDSSVRAVVTTGDIVSGLERQNRREGRTVVPLGV